MTDEANGRTHEPSLRELTGNLDSLEKLLFSKIDALRETINVLDRLYKERDDSRRLAVDAALAAAREQTSAAFASSEKAIVKAEEAQKAYNQSHNDLAHKMDEQNKATMPRSETEAGFRSMNEKIQAVKDMVMASGNITEGGKAVKEDARLVTLLVVSVVGTLFSMLISSAGLLLSLWKLFGPVGQ